MLRLQPGDDIERYTVEAQVGSGGMATVYRVRHKHLGSVHALKVLRVPVPAIQARLVQEGRSQARLQHPNTVTVTDVLDIQGMPGLVLEYIEGPSLDQLLVAQRFTLAQADALAQGILDGVDAAHAQGVVHRDLKPANILIQLRGVQLVPKVTDFGLAKLFDETPSEQRSVTTQSGTTMGTPAYMAPEQISDASTVDARADIFSLGAILYELVTGERAFPGEDLLDLYRRIGDGVYRPPEELVPDLPERMRIAIAGALQPDPDKRFASVHDLLEAWFDHCPVTAAAGPWDAGALDRARGLAVAVDILDPALLESLNAPASAETYTAESLLGQVSQVTQPTEATPAETSGSMRVYGVVALALVLLVGALSYPLWGPDPNADIFTATTVPAAFEDEDKQSLVEEAWLALLDGDTRRAHHAADRLTAAAPDSTVAQVLLYLSAGLEGDPAANAAYFATLEASRKEDAQLRPLLEGIDQLPRGGWDAAEAPVRAYLQENSKDLMGHLIVGGMPMGFGGPWEVRERSLDRVSAAAPDSPLPYLIAARQLSSVGRNEEADLRAREGLVRAPDNPLLHMVVGSGALAIGDLQGARQAYLTALRLDRGLDRVRIELAELEWLSGRPEVAEELMTELVGNTATTTQHATAFTAGARVMFSLGRHQQAEAMLVEARTLHEQEQNYLAALEIEGELLRMALVAQDVDRLQRTMERFRTSVLAPELPEDLTDRLGVQVLFLEAIVQALQGEEEGPRLAIERLRRDDDASDYFADTLELQLAIQQGDTAKLREALEPTEGCRAPRLEQSLVRAGALEEAQPLLRTWAAESCFYRGYTRYMAAMAHLSLAELVVEEDPEEAMAQLEAMRSLWPDPESSPAMDRAIALRDRLSAG